MKRYLFALLSMCIYQIALGQILQPAGGGQYIFPENDEKCLSEEDRIIIKAQIAESRQALKRSGKLQEANEEQIVLFDWPLQQNPSLGWNDYYGISNYVDQNNSGALLDYNCGTRTYNGHKGTDYFTWPFGWYLVENDMIEVVAAEAGTIILKNDGEDDDHCSCFGTWNAVYVEHADGSIAWYGHLKKNSLTNKAVGDPVAVGEYLGIVASSGCSTGPHLHFEIYDANNDLIDPYTGSCNNLNNQTWWQNQIPESTPRINTLLTHSAIPQFGCPGTNESPNLDNTIEVGQAFQTAAYYHDQNPSLTATYRLRQPNGSIYATWNHTSPATYYASWWYWEWTLPSQGPFGTWQFEVTFNSETYEHAFEFIDPNSPCSNTAQNTWIGPSTGTWNGADSNWSKGVIPEICDDVVIPAGADIKILSGNFAECYTLQVDVNATFEVEDGAILEVQNP